MSHPHPPSPPDQEQFVRLFAQYEGNVRAFVTSLLPNWEGVDEVMQETSIVLWRKFDEFDPDRPGSKFTDWAFMIARYEVLKYRRKRRHLSQPRGNLVRRVYG